MTSLNHEEEHRFVRCWAHGTRIPVGQRLVEAPAPEAQLKRALGSLHFARHRYRLRFLDRLRYAQGSNPLAIIALLVFVPFFIIYRKRAIPYSLALISHLLIGDIGGQMQLFWPFSATQYGFNAVSIFSPINLLIELSLFAIATFVLYKTCDWKVFFTSDRTNLLLLIPIATVLLPTTIGYPFSQSLLLSNQYTVVAVGIAHLFYLFLFSTAILKVLASMYRNVKHSSAAPASSIRKNCV